MRILVTGAAGFIGSHLVDLLVAKGHDVIGIDNLSNGLRSNLEFSINKSNFTFMTVDLKDSDKVDEIFKNAKIDAVYHLAARGSVPASISDPLATFRNNVEVSHNLMLTCIKYKIERFIYASSSSVYGQSNNPIKSECDLENPINPYGLSKYVTEQYASRYHKQYGLNCVGLRFFNVYGPRQRWDIEHAAVIPKFMAASILGRPISINGDGTQSRDFTFVGSVCTALYKFLDIPSHRWAGDTFNVCNNLSTSLLELIEYMKRIFGYNPYVQFFDKRIGDIDKSRGDNSKYNAVLGRLPKNGLINGLKETAEYYKSTIKIDGKESV